MSPVDAGLGARAAGMTTAYGSTEGMPRILPIIAIIFLIILAFLVRRAIRKNRLMTELHYRKGEEIMSISHLSDKIPAHTHGKIIRIHNTEPITIDVQFIDINGEILDTIKVEELDIVKLGNVDDDLKRLKR